MSTLNCSIGDVSTRDMRQVLDSLLKVGVNLSVEGNSERMLAMILAEARRFMRAEAGALYVVRKDHLLFDAAQNGRLADDIVTGQLLGRTLPLDRNSLAGYVAQTGEVVRIDDTAHPPDGAPYRLNLDLDDLTGYRTRSLLAVPLRRPGGETVGVLELINHLDGDEPAPFPDADACGILAMASMAAVTIHNALLQEEIKRAHFDTIVRLSQAAEFSDRLTGEHIRRMSRVSALVAKGYGLDDETVELIRYASPMHDIGKIAIDHAILNKPGRLNESERKAIERHTVIGASILQDGDNDLLAMAHDVALLHHERFGGGGYPEGRRGEAIPLAARIVHLADVFDALMSRRYYKPAYPLDRAIAIVRQLRDDHFDPDVVEAFFAVLDDVTALYPVGGEAETSSAND
jgi:HD-GYP domain-containing protein (c-di-GMP phosphodiesterase class II)